MTIRPIHRVLLLSAAAAMALLSCPLRLSADLTWDPRNGWNLQGGVLSGLFGRDGQAALDRMNSARADEERGERFFPARAYEKIAGKYSNSVYAPEALYRAGMLRMERGQLYKAFDDFQQMVGRYPNTKHFNEVIGQEYHIAQLLLDGHRNRMLGLIPSFANRGKGVEDFSIIVVNAPYSDYAPLAVMAVARGDEYLGNTDEAIDALERMINTYPQSILTPTAYLNLGRLHASLAAGPYYDQASTKQAISYYEDFMILFPGDVNIPQAALGLDAMKIMLSESKVKIGDFYFYKRDNYTAARVFYNEAITAYPDSTMAALARKRLKEVDAKAAHRIIVAPPATPAPKKRFWFF